MDIGSALTLSGLVLVLGTAVAYLVLLFVVHGFTYRTWIFHAVEALGIGLAAAGWLAGGSGLVAALAVAIGVLWFAVTWHELRLVGSSGIRVRPGDRMPAFDATTTGGIPFTDADLVSQAPALLVLYRGWWCPSSKVQLDEVLSNHAPLNAAGIAIFAGSVDSPAESEPMQQYVGAGFTILCDIPVSLLDTIGVRDTRGAPWYDRLLFGAAHRDISMPAAVVVDGSGRIRYAHRSTQVDDRPKPAEILASVGRGIDWTRPAHPGPR